MNSVNVQTPNRAVVYLVGAGPGDPELITLRGAWCLSRADVVVYDYLADPLLLRSVPIDAERVYVGKKAGQHTLSQEEINQYLVTKARENKIVVRLKGGDPFVFGRGGEECETLAEAGIPFEVVPGITAGVAASAYAGIPVTHRGRASSVAFITGHEDPQKPDTSIHWEHLAGGVDTLVFYMGVGNLPSIVERLVAFGRPSSTPVALIRWGTKPGQETVTGTLETIVDNVQAAGLRPPAIIVVGDVVGMRDKLAWFDRRPLFGRRVVVTRTRMQASSFVEKLRMLGADPIELPTIEIESLTHNSIVSNAVQSVGRYNWLIFTSANAVRLFLDACFARHNDIRALGTVRIAAIGPATADAVREYHVGVDVVAEKAVAEGLIERLSEAESWNGKHVLIPRAAEARPVLPDYLKQQGARVDVVPVYKTIRPTETDEALLEAIERNEYDLVTFTSSSTAENFAALFGEHRFSKLAPSLRAAAIGPVTAQTLKGLGVTPVLEASDHTIDGLTEAIREYFER